MQVYQGSKSSQTVSKLFTDTNVSGTFQLDWGKYDTFYLTLTGDTLFEDKNLPLTSVNTKVLTIYVRGEFNLNFPSDWLTNMFGSYDGTKRNQIAVEYIEDATFWTQINN